MARVNLEEKPREVYRTPDPFVRAVMRSNGAALRSNLAASLGIGVKLLEDPEVLASFEAS